MHIGEPRFNDFSTQKWLLSTLTRKKSYLKLQIYTSQYFCTFHQKTFIFITIIKAKLYTSMNNFRNTMCTKKTSVKVDAHIMTKKKNVSFWYSHTYAFYYSAPHTHPPPRFLRQKEELKKIKKISSAHM